MSRAPKLREDYREILDRKLIENGITPIRFRAVPDEAAVRAPEGLQGGQHAGPEPRAGAANRIRFGIPRWLNKTNVAWGVTAVGTFLAKEVGEFAYNKYVERRDYIFEKSIESVAEYTWGHEKTAQQKYDQFCVDAQKDPALKSDKVTVDTFKEMDGATLRDALLEEVDVSTGQFIREHTATLTLAEGENARQPLVLLEQAKELHMMEMEVDLANKVQGKAEDAEYSAADEQRMPALKEECITTYKEKGANAAFKVVEAANLEKKGSALRLLQECLIELEQEKQAET